MLRRQDQVWLVSNRSGGCDWEQQADSLQVWRYDPQQAWRRATLDDLTATDDPRVVTTIFVHGNRISWCDAFSRGWSAYRSLVRCADSRPVRFIIWSWPSEKSCGPVRDAREKACRTDPSGYCLARLLQRIDSQVPVSLWAHSFGARIVTGALHLLGGGELAGRQLDLDDRPARVPMQAVLLVAALDHDWLLPGRYHGRAMSQLGQLLLVNNCCDALLNRYHLIYGRRCSQRALGFAGVGRWGVADQDWAKVHQVNACPVVGRRHSFVGYLASGGLVAQMRAHLLFEQPRETVVASSPATGPGHTATAAAR